jgi:hypothetical protein
MRPLRNFALIAAFAGTIAGARAEDIDALALAGFWCTWDDKTKTENVPRNRAFLLVRQVEAANAAAEPNATDYLVDVTGDVRGQRILLLQKQKNADGSA